MSRFPASGGGLSTAYTYVQDGFPSDAEEGESLYHVTENRAYVYDGDEWIEQTVTDHGELSGVGTSDHHARYTDSEAVSAAPDPIVPSASTARYGDAEPVAEDLTDYVTTANNDYVDTGYSQSIDLSDNIYISVDYRVYEPETGYTQYWRLVDTDTGETIASDSTSSNVLDNEYVMDVVGIDTLNIKTQVKIPDGGDFDITQEHIKFHPPTRDSNVP